MLPYSKPPLLYSEQIALLVSRGLVVTDAAEAERWLMQVGYYRLSAYFIPFRIAESDNFRPGTTFEQITKLYAFDAELRRLFTMALDVIEVAVRSTLTYRLAHDFGPFGHADPRNFRRGFDHRTFMVSIDREERRSKELFLSHFRGRYSDYELPIWMATELISFGAISTIYKNLPAKRRKPIAQVFKTPEAVFESWLHSLTNIRNICAHHNRLWNRELPVPPTLLDKWREAGIRNERVYCIALILQHLLHVINPNTKWKEVLKRFIKANPWVNLSAMEFPANWDTLDPWK